MKIHALIFSAAMAALTPLASFAGFVDLEPESYAGKEDGAAAPGTAQPAGTVGFGKDLPLPIVVTQILESAGAKFEAVIPDEFKTRNASWQAGASWPETLEKAADTAGLQADIRWSEGKIYFSEKKPPEPEKPAPVFEVKRADNFVSTALARWATDAGWQLVWDTDVDLVVDADAAYPGAFEKAVEVLFGELSLTKVPLKATLYQGNKVIRVSHYEGANK